MLFCDDCGRLKQRRKVQGEMVSFCPECDDTPAPLASRSSSGGNPQASKRSKDQPSLSQASRGSGRSRSSSSSSKGKRKRRSKGTSSGSSGGSGDGGKQRKKPEKLKVPKDLDLFPYEEVRPGQKDLLEDIRRAVERGGHLVAYAPTGLGKTASSLVPALEYAFRENKRVFFLTSKQSQHKIAVETLQAIREQCDVPFVVSDVIGKQDMCAREEAQDLFSKRFAEFCRREQAAGTCTYWENTNTQAVRFLKQGIHPVEDVVDVAKHRFHVCPHQAALDVGQQAHVVVCDYNYFFSEMREGMSERLNVDLEDTILVVDEAHNLPERIRDHLTLELNVYALDDALEELGDLKSQGNSTAYLARILEGLKELLDELVEEPAPEGKEWDGDERLVDRDEWVDAVENRLRSRSGQLTGLDYEQLMDELRDMEHAFQDEFKEPSRGITLVREFFYNWRINRKGLVRLLRKAMVPTLRYEILDPAVLSRSVFRRVHASVVMSGTLYPMEMYRDVLGMPGDTEIASYTSPFPKHHRMVLADDSVTTRYKDRSDEMFQRMARNLAEVAEATPGNVAAFFPSYNILERVNRLLPRFLSSKELVVEEREQNKEEKQGLVGDLRLSDNALLLGVMGGSLSEGYDYANNLLKGVVIVGLPFARPTLSVEALIDYYKGKFGGKGYDYAYVYPAMNRVLQAAGRCIRSSDDKGVIVLMDKRFTWNRYQRSFPDEFGIREVSDPAQAVRSFWKRW